MAQCSLYSVDALIMDDQIEDNRTVETPEIEKKQDNIKSVEHTKEKRRNREEKNKRKDEKRPAEQLLKGLNDVRTVEDKLEVISKKYSEVVDENRKLQMTLKQHDKKMICLQREKEQLQRERNKGVLARTKLEILSRELQKQNKAVKEQSLLKVREQEEIRRALTEKFQSGLAQITKLMNLNMEKNAKMCEENFELNKKFKAVHEQFQMREQEMLQMHSEMKSELKIAGMRLMSVRLETNAEKEALLKEKQQLLYKLTEYQVQIRELQATEVGLRSQISMYTDKYDEFQNALTRSNKVYGEFNEEMERMSKKILMLEKETTLWKQRWENSHAALLEMTADKQIRESEMAKLNKKLTLLDNLCSMFQFERAELIAQLKKEKGEPETQVVQGETQESAKLAKGVDELSKQCLKMEVKYGELHSAHSKIKESIETSIKEESSQNEVLEQKKNTNTSHKKRGNPERKLKNKESKQIECKATDENQEQNEKCSLETDKICNDLNLVAEDTKLIESSETTKVQPEESSHDKKEELVESMQDKEKKSVESSQEKAKDPVESLQEKTKDTVESLPEKTKDCVESLQEETKDPVESLQDENRLEELPIKETKNSSTENMNACLVQEKCLLVVNSGTSNELSTKIEENGVEYTNNSSREQKEVLESQTEEVTAASNTKLSRLQSEEESNVKLSNTIIHSETKGRNQESDMGNLCDKIVSLNTETENIIGQLYEAIDSVKQETIEDDWEMLNNTVSSLENGEMNKHIDDAVVNENNILHNEQCEEVLNERLDGDADKPCTNTNASETQPIHVEIEPIKKTDIIEKNIDMVTESITKPLSNESLSTQSSTCFEPSSTKVNCTETKSTKAASVKNGKRRKK